MGHIDNGIIPVLKHFPGHGAVLSDTHNTISECNSEYDELSPHVEPFKQLYNKFKIPIMTSHITYKKYHHSQLLCPQSGYLNYRRPYLIRNLYLSVMI